MLDKKIPTLREKKREKHDPDQEILLRENERENGRM